MEWKGISEEWNFSYVVSEVFIKEVIFELVGGCI